MAEAVKERVADSFRDTQIVVITSDPARPSFLVHKRVSDAFIAEQVARLYGPRADGDPHDWESFDFEGPEQPGAET